MLPLALILVAAVAGGCTVPTVAPDPSGRMVILDHMGRLSVFPPTDDWVVEEPGFGAGNRITVTKNQGRWGLKLLGGPSPLLIARRTNGVLPISPYLSWSWAMDWQGAGAHPVRMVIGFHGGSPKSGSWGSQPLAWLGSALPPYDRRLEVTWGESALERGNLVLPQGNGRKPARYTVRGGREKAGAWFDETVDLLDLYSRAWPGDDAAKARVMFVGMAAAASTRPVTGTVSNIILSR